MDHERAERDLVLAPNEFAYVSDETKGNINVFVGPNKTSLANTDKPVVFDYETKRFVKTTLEKATQTFVTAPEGWYIVLKNPSKTMESPRVGTASTLTDLEVGTKINMRGPVSLPLWPGQMTKVLQGHHLRSNEYLIVRVYDEDSAVENWTNAVIKPQRSADGSGGEGSNGEVTPSMEIPDLTMGKLLVIKGTDVSFYIPPTGVEVVPDVAGRSGAQYVRSAVTLERLEYCILLDEDGNKRFVRGPDVVFPKPTERFVEENGKRKFRAIELNPQMALYLKVIADYTEENGEKRTAGEELFITGADTRIYYPRPEHAIIKYDSGESSGIQFAVAIPEGEARYVLDKNSGNVELVHGPKMFLPDPREEVIVLRVLDPKVCELLYPNNQEALAHNLKLANKHVKKLMLESATAGDIQARGAPKSVALAGVSGGGMYTASTSGINAHALIEEATEEWGGDDFKRKENYTPPRTITLDTKYEGAVRVCIWTGYAMQVTKSSGESRILQGPQTALLAYDENPEVLSLSTGKPKNTDKLLRTAYLRVKNNIVSDIVSAETADLVNVKIKLIYRVNFEGDSKKWFNVENYVKLLSDHMRSLIRNSVKRVGIEQFNTDPISLVRNTVLGESVDGKREGKTFEENGMFVYDVEILRVDIGDDRIAEMLKSTQHESVRQALEIGRAERNLEVSKRAEQIAQETAKVKTETVLIETDLANQETSKKLEMALLRIDTERQQQEAISEKETLAHEHNKKVAELTAAREQIRHNTEVEYKQKLLDMDIQDLAARTSGWVDKAAAISPKLIDALQSFSDKDALARISESMAPLSILGGKSIADIINNMLQGTRFDGLLSKSDVPMIEEAKETKSKKPKGKTT